jgi:two-component system, NarL family, nitrate/nitrite response regulator NarL
VSAQPAIGVIVADDHPLFRLGLVVVLRQHGFDVVGQSGRGDDVLELVDRHRPRLVLLDVRMPGLDGLEVCRQLSERWPALRSVILTTFDEPAVRAAAYEAGAAAFFGKQTQPDANARWCRRLVDEPRLRLLRPTAVVPSLSPRERQVLGLMERGLSNKAIATSLAISPETVKDHCGRIFGKFGTRDRMATVHRAHELGFFATLDPDPAEGGAPP